MRSASPPLSLSWQHGQVAIPTLLQHPPDTDLKMSPSCGQRRSSMNRRANMENVSPHRIFAVQRPAQVMVSLMPVGLKQPERAVLGKSWRGTEQQPASTAAPPSCSEQAEQKLPSKYLQRRPPSPSPYSENVDEKREWPNKEDGIMADTLQDLKFLEKLLSSNLDQGEMGNSEVHRTLFKSLVHLKKIMTLAPEVGSVSSWKPV